MKAVCVKLDKSWTIKRFVLYEIYLCFIFFNFGNRFIYFLIYLFIYFTLQHCIGFAVH